jgi:hypothetical protein
VSTGERRIVAIEETKLKVRGRADAIPGSHRPQRQGAPCGLFNPHYGNHVDTVVFPDRVLEMCTNRLVIVTVSPSEATNHIIA